MKLSLFLSLVVGIVFTSSVINAATVTLTSPGVASAVQHLGNEDVDVGPHTLTVDGKSFAALCIDFSDRTSLNTTWEASVTRLDSKSLNATYHPHNALQYDEAAFLYNRIIKPAISDQDRIDIQDAAWNIFSPSAMAGNLNSNATAYYNAAVKNGTGIMPFEYEIISSLDPIHNRQQEFIVGLFPASVPEPATMALMGAGLAIAGMAARKRQKKEAQ